VEHSSSRAGSTARERITDDRWSNCNQLLDSDRRRRGANRLEAGTKEVVPMSYDDIIRSDSEPSPQELAEDRYDNLPTVHSPELDAIFDSLPDSKDYVWDDKLWQWVPKLKLTGEV
jgi:hypothetical protein